MADGQEQSLAQNSKDHVGDNIIDSPEAQTQRATTQGTTNLER